MMLPSPGLGREKSGQPQGEAEPWARPERSQASVPSLSSLSLPTCSTEAWASSSASVRAPCIQAGTAR